MKYGQARRAKAAVLILLFYRYIPAFYVLQLFSFAEESSTEVYWNNCIRKNIWILQELVDS